MYSRYPRGASAFAAGATVHPLLAGAIIGKGACEFPGVWPPRLTRLTAHHFFPPRPERARKQGTHQPRPQNARDYYSSVTCQLRSRRISMCQGIMYCPVHLAQRQGCFSNPFIAKPVLTSVNQGILAYGVSVQRGWGSRTVYEN